MSQSLVKNYVHITFSTKHRQPMLNETIGAELYAYIGGICSNLESPPVEIGGYADHIHILCMLSKKMPLMKLLEEVKSHSSKWIKTKGDIYRNFYWQDGYGAFSVNPSQVEVVKRYIQNYYCPVKFSLVYELKITLLCSLIYSNLNSLSTNISPLSG